MQQQNRCISQSLYGGVGWRGVMVRHLWSREKGLTDQAKRSSQKMCVLSLVLLLTMCLDWVPKYPACLPLGPSSMRFQLSSALTSPRHTQPSDTTAT